MTLLLTTADRFRAAQAKAWQAHPPPCRENPAVLACNCPNTACDLGLDPGKCKHKKALKKAINQKATTVKIISQIHRSEYLNHHISISLSGDRTWSYTIHSQNWDELVQATGFDTHLQALNAAKTNLKELLICQCH